MKRIKHWAILWVALFTGLVLNAAEEAHQLNPRIEGPEESILSKFIVSGGYVARFPNITDTGDRVDGAAITLAYPLNKAVSINLEGIAYETDNWGGTALDETSLLGKYSFMTTFKERLGFYGIAGGGRRWDIDEWNMAIGLGAELNFAKSFSAGVDYRIRAYFGGEEDKDGLVALKVNYKF